MLSPKAFYNEWKIKRHHERFYMALGVIFLLLALIGVTLPIMPQIPFAIASAFFFSKGSQKIHLAIRHNKVMGEAVCDWEDHKVIRPKNKVFSVGAMIVGAYLGHRQLVYLWAWCLNGIFLVCILFVLTRKSSPLSIPIWKKKLWKWKWKRFFRKKASRVLPEKN